MPSAIALLMGWAGISDRVVSRWFLGEADAVDSSFPGIWATC